MQMEKEQFEAVLVGLATKKPYFLSENEFQIALAEELANFERKNGHEGACAYLDQNKNIINRKTTMNPDIVVTKIKFPKDEYAACQDLDYVECKYKTCGEYVEDERVVRQSSKKKQAYNIARCEFWEDVERMESVDSKQPGLVNKYVVFLTNDEKFWSELNSQENSGDRELRLHNGRGDVTGEMIYYTNRNGVPANKTIILKGAYRLEKDAWKPYGKANFKYLLIEVN